MSTIHPKNLSINNYTYTLPEDKIAKYPMSPRDESKLLVFKNGAIEQGLYKQLPSYLAANTLLIFNNTKVVEARLLFTKPTGGQIELFCLEPHSQYTDITTAMLTKGEVRWLCLVGGAKKWKDEPLVKFVTIENKGVTLTATLVEKLADCFLISFSWNDSSLSFAEVLHGAGFIPLPPYLNRQVEQDDKNNYQTIYAQHNGSVAAPTAGLHFTESLFNSLNSQSITHQFVTLHVGAGTFKPVKAATMSEHEMHAEFIDVTIELIEQLKTNNPIIPVGTTSLRTIESLYWIGVKVMRGNKLSLILQDGLQQWDAYELPQSITKTDALQALILEMKTLGLTRIITKTQLLIAPSYKFRIAKALITNFHQPQSTLLLLVAAMIGEDWKRVYKYALEHDFRFLSYGDGSLLFP